MRIFFFSLFFTFAYVRDAITCLTKIKMNEANILENQKTRKQMRKSDTTLSKE